MDNKVIINAHDYEVVDLYTPNHEYIGEIKNPNELYDVRIQIFLQGVDDYYLVRNAETGEKEVIYFNKFGNLCGGNLYDEEEAKRMVALVKSIQQDSLGYIVPFYKNHGNDCFDWDDGACDELWILEELLIKYIDDFSVIFFSENRYVNYRSLDYEIRKG